MKPGIKRCLQKLDVWDCILVLLRILRIHWHWFFRIYFQIPLPVSFSLRATTMMFLLLFVMPYHPLAIPTAFGIGLSYGILFRSLELVMERT
jgi:hypothetical protein